MAILASHQGHKGYTENTFNPCFTLQVFFDSHELLVTVGQPYRYNQYTTRFELFNQCLGGVIYISSIRMEPYEI